MFRLDVPQGRIGTLCPAGDTLYVIPRIAVRERYCADRVYATLEEFVGALAEQKRQTVFLSPTTHTVIDRLVATLPEVCARLADNASRRLVLVHDDLNETNILVDAHGEVTGIIDWEFHSLLPAVLAAQYPRWIRYDSIYDPRTTSDGKMEKYLLASPEDAARLRGAFAQVCINLLCRSYSTSLTNGVSTCERGTRSTGAL